MLPVALPELDMPCTCPIPKKLPLPIAKAPAPETTFALQYRPPVELILSGPEEVTGEVLVPSPVAVPR